MKACLVLQNQNSKIAHAIGVYLKEHHGVDSFSAYAVSPAATDLIHNQTDIVYDPILVDHELHAAYKKETVDLEFIKKFENKYGPPNLWQYFYPDRKLMMSIGPKEETTTDINPLYNHEDLLRIFQARAKAIEKMLVETKPDFILFFAIGMLGHLLMYNIAKKLRIKTFNLDFARIGNLVHVSEDYHTITGARDLFAGVSENKITEKHQAQAKALIKKFRDTGNLDLEYVTVYNDAFRPKPGRDTFFKRVNKISHYLITLSKNYWTNRNKFLYGETSLNPGRFILYKLRQRARKLQNIESLYSYQKEEDYAFYPLHFEPELATLLLSPMNFDQLNVIRQIARSLPLHFKLYVKEHPAMVYKRSKKYYKELLKIPNVKLISHTVKSSDLIKKAKLITVITGTAGWEATLYGKPVITFGDIFYNTVPFVRHVKTVDDLPAIIHEQLNHFAYNEDQLIRFVAAMISDAVPFNFNALWYENDMQILKNDPGLRAFADELMRKARV